MISKYVKYHHVICIGAQVLCRADIDSLCECSSLIGKISHAAYRVFLTPLFMHIQTYSIHLHPSFWVVHSLSIFSSAHIYDACKCIVVQAVHGLSFTFSHLSRWRRRDLAVDHGGCVGVWGIWRSPSDLWFWMVSAVPDHFRTSSIWWRAQKETSPGSWQVFKGLKW